MTESQRFVAMVFGVLLASIGLYLHVRGRGGDERGTVKAFGAEVTLTPALLILILGCAVFFLPFILPTQASTTPEAAFESPSSSPTSNRALEKRLRRVDPSILTVSASSELPPASGNEYFATNLIDGDPTTAWVEGADGLGAGESIHFTFSSPVNLRRIDIVNGYVKSSTLFKDNSRVRLLAIDTEHKSFSILLEDIPQLQEISRDFGSTQSLTMSVRSVYPGSRFQDTALTSIAFWRSP